MKLDLIGAEIMNLVLFDQKELDLPLRRSDARARHIVEVLRRGPGESFDVGVVGGPRGKAVVESIGAESLELKFSLGESPLPADPIILLVGLPRPQTARKILRDAPGLGLEAVHFFRSGKGERSYGDSSLWATGEWRAQLADGAAQAFDTRLPGVSAGRELADVLAENNAAKAKLALDPYEATARLSDCPLALPAVIAIGPERGWSAAEREVLRQNSFTLVNLGQRILRTETACVAAVAIVKSRLGIL